MSHWREKVVTGMRRRSDAGASLQDVPTVLVPTIKVSNRSRTDFLEDRRSTVSFLSTALGIGQAHPTLEGYQILCT